MTPQSLTLSLLETSGFGKSLGNSINARRRLRRTRLRNGLPACLRRDGCSSPILLNNSLTTRRFCISRFDTTHTYYLFKSSHAAHILQFLTDNIVYIGFTMQNGKGREWEQCRFALHDQGPLFVRRDGHKIKGPKELGQLGFCSLTLHESSFANNIIKLETQLQTLLWNQKNRLWRQQGGGNSLYSYYSPGTKASSCDS